MDSTTSNQGCDVFKCPNNAIYKCPRCGINYCSLRCYRKHSEKCVQDFCANDENQLDGRRVSDVERRQFGSLMRRFIYNDDGYFFQEDEAPIDSSGPHVKEKEMGLVGDKQVATREDIGSGEESTEEAAALLTNLMNDLDDSGKDALFTVLQKSMALEQSNASSEDFVKSHRTRSNATTNLRRQKYPDVISSESDGIQKDLLAVLEKLIEDMETMDLSYEDILSSLPHDLRMDFESRLRDGRVDDLIAEWTPWWDSTCKDLGCDNEKDFIAEKGILPPLPTETDLLVPVAVARVRGSDLLMCSIVDVVASYCAVMRFTNGDWLVDTAESARKLWFTSTVLSEDVRHGSIQAACASVVAKTSENVRPIRDAAAILAAASPFVVRALFDTANILREAALVHSHGSYRKDVFRKVRKVHFLMAWAFAEPSSTYIQSARHASSFADAHSGNCNEVLIAKQVVNTGAR